MKRSPFCGLVLVVAAVLALSCDSQSPPKSATSAAEDRVRDQLEPQLREALASDEQCAVTRLFYQGFDVKRRLLYWSAACENGKSLMVSVNGSTGKTTYLDCGIASVAGVKCFEPLK